MPLIKYGISLYFFIIIVIAGHGVFGGQHKTDKRQTSCSIDKYQCSNGFCIDSTLTCDGIPDCPDSSDETQQLCSELISSCPSFAFRCKYGACVDRSAKCDGKPDCVDGSDENLPECKNHHTPHTTSSTECHLDQFHCKSGECIDSTTTCDGKVECKDGSDETHELCKKNRCPSYTFTCNYGACIPKTNRCNGIKNCADGSDEGVRCNQTSTNQITSTNVIHKPTTVQPNKKKQCTVPNTEGSIYTLENVNKTVSPGSKVNQYDFILETCKSDYYQDGSTRSRGCIDNEKWTPVFTDNLCLKTCPTMLSDSLNLVCTFNGDITPCSKPSKPGTKLKPKCKPTHSLPNGQTEYPIELVCQKDGQWSGKLYTCVPDCGRLYVPSQTLIANGNKSEVGEAPWNVGVYQVINETYSSMICGGSIISPQLIVSAAHCFNDHGVPIEYIIDALGLYKIGVGKYTRDINIMDNKYTQIIDVQKIYIADRYYGEDGKQAEDIAILILPIKVTISIAVSPVCVDWNKKFEEKNGSLGLVVGWGKTEKGVSSPKLLKANLPYIDYATCRNIVRKGFEAYLVDDKFCAGSLTGQGVLEGDSGAGLTFIHNNLHYLTGVVSIKDAESNSSIALFTEVSEHIPWIQNFYLNYTNNNGMRLI